MKKKKKGKPYHLVWNIEGEPTVVEMKRFADWLQIRDKKTPKQEKRTYMIEGKKL